MSDTSPAILDGIVALRIGIEDRLGPERYAELMARGAELSLEEIAAAPSTS